jgi:hypothetical protein
VVSVALLAEAASSSMMSLPLFVASRFVSQESRMICIASLQYDLEGLDIEGSKLELHLYPALNSADVQLFQCVFNNIHKFHSCYLQVSTDGQRSHPWDLHEKKWLSSASLVLVHTHDNGFLVFVSVEIAFAAFDGFHNHRGWVSESEGEIGKQTGRLFAISLWTSILCTATWHSLLRGVLKAKATFWTSLCP